MTDCPNVAEFLLGGKDPARIALRMLDRDYTYGELQSAASKVAAYLVRAGGNKGDRVLLVSENSFFWVAAYLGTLQAGMVSVPLPTTIAGPDFDFILKTTEARFAFLQTRFATANKNHLEDLHVVTDRKTPDMADAIPFEELQLFAEPYNVAKVEADDLAALMFTSGSTGKSRGVMVSHGNIVANTNSIIEYLRLTENDRIMTVLPFHYCFGTSLLHTHLKVAGSLVIDLRFMYPDKILERMMDTECTGFAGVPSHFQILLRKSSLPKKTFPHLRYVQQAGGHLAPQFIQELREALPTTQIFVMYGQTEATARLSYIPPERLEQKLGSIGKAIPGVKLQVLDGAGREVRLGEIGEIVAEGENVTQGYWRAPEEAAVSFRNGKLYTGDIGSVDEDGFITILDRAKDFLKCGGKRISCRQIEDQLLAMGDLLEVAVVGIPDDILGEAVKAFVVPRGSDGELEDRLITFCKQHMPVLHIPKEIAIVNALPKNASGKVLKQELKMR